MTHITNLTSLDIYSTVIKLVIITYYPLTFDRIRLDDISRTTVVYEYALIM